MRGPGRGAVALARRLLANAWVVDDVEALPPGFTGVAVTRAGRAWFGFTRELRQAPQGGAERVLAQRNRRDELVRESSARSRPSARALEAVEQAGAAVAAADGTRDAAERALREAERERSGGAGGASAARRG